MLGRQGNSFWASSDVGLFIVRCQWTSGMPKFGAPACIFGRRDAGTVGTSTNGT